MRSMPISQRSFDAPRERKHPRLLQIARLLNRLATGAVQLERLLDQEQRTDYPPPIRINPQIVNQQAEDAANNLRARLGVGLGPIPDLSACWSWNSAYGSSSVRFHPRSPGSTPMIPRSAPACSSTPNITGNVGPKQRFMKPGISCRIGPTPTFSKRGRSPLGRRAVRKKIWTSPPDAGFGGANALRSDSRFGGKLRCQRADPVGSPVRRRNGGYVSAP